VPDEELTVDQLAARVGMTVRNVRAYAARGLLPAPRLVGRTGWYGPEHVARLMLVREMLGQGYTLAAVERALESTPTTASAGSLALHRALIAPWLPDLPVESDVATLTARVGVPSAPGVLADLAAMGVLELLEDDRIRILDPTLLEAGIQVVRLGIRPEALVEAQRQVIELVEQAADIYVDMFRRTVWQDFVAQGTPADGWPRIQEVVERLQPVAAQALLASFRSAMAAAVAQEVDSQVETAPDGIIGAPSGAVAGG
jgi:DNA-binding transcriptional MerR regulator